MQKIVLVLVALALVHNSSALPRRRGWKPKIVGGEPVVKNELPYQVSFQYADAHFCGGTIISEKVVVTAAHCVFEGLEDLMSVLAGEHSLSQVDGTEQRRKVTSVVVHENYDPEPSVSPNDIALLKLTQPFTFNGAVKALPLAPEGHDATGEALVSGWGDLDWNGEAPDLLHKVHVTIVSDQDCTAAYGGEMTETMICAGQPEGGKDACQGDSGGPLVANDNGYSYLAGVVSWGEGCAFPNYPGVYTEVAYFLDWIAIHSAN